MQPSDRHEFFAPERLLAFSDGVFAVVITLLVLIAIIGAVVLARKELD